MLFTPSGDNNVSLGILLLAPLGPLLIGLKYFSLLSLCFLSNSFLHEPQTLLFPEALERSKNSSFGKVFYPFNQGGMP